LPIQKVKLNPSILEIPWNGKNAKLQESTVLIRSEVNLWENNYKICPKKVL
jgi:hypothetical protein